jgi:hypothetical protein
MKIQIDKKLLKYLVEKQRVTKTINQAKMKWANQNAVKIWSKFKICKVTKASQPIKISLKEVE